MKIVSWNLLHSIGATIEEVIHLVDRERPDLLLMQEATAAIDRLPTRISGFYSRNPLPGRHHGLAAWSLETFAEVPRHIALQPGLFVKRIAQIVSIGGLTVANVHLSHGQLMNRRQLRRIAGHPKTIGFDLVEISPPFDVQGITGRTGAALILNFLYGLATRG